MMIRDQMTAEDLANLNDQRPVKVNVFEAAKKIKTWNMLIHEAEKHNVNPSEALTVILKHVKKNWAKFKIIRDGDFAAEISNLLLMEEKITRKQLYVHDYLKDFHNTLKKALNINTKTYKKMSILGREHVRKNYDFENYEKQWIKIMDEMVEKYGSWETKKGYKRWHLLEVA